MNMKKIVAAAVASVMAVSSMAVNSFAATEGYLNLVPDWGNGEAKAANAVEWIAKAWDGANVTKPDDADFTASTADKVEVTVTAEIDLDAYVKFWVEDYGYGEEGLYKDCFAFAIALSDGSQLKAILEEGKTSYTLTTTADQMQKSNLEDHIKWGGKEEDFDPEAWFGQVQLGHCAEVGLKSITISYAVKSEGGAADPAGDETTSGDETSAPANDPAPGSNPSGGDGKDPANTGIEGVAVVAGLAVLATGAIVVAKKRK
ncbi:MAG: hypothetical protein K2N36_02055 [Ruminiclostridium sp.]|nr:hypothetical protein [Ruminiclostridium sp.]